MRFSMQYYYGDKNVLRALDEAEFWKRQEIEHTSVIQLVTPNLEDRYVTGLNGFELQFSKMYAELVKYVESAVRSRGELTSGLYNEMAMAVKMSIQLSAEFVEYLNTMLGQSRSVQGNASSQTVINHIIRESQYFIGIDQLLFE